MRLDGGRRGGCATCGASRSLLCCNCANEAAPIERRERLQQLQKQRDELEAKLTPLLSQKEKLCGQQVESSRARDLKHEASAKAAQAGRELDAAHMALQAGLLANRSRRQQVESALQTLSARRADMLGNHLPTLLRYQSLTHAHVSAVLQREQHAKLRQLLAVLPIRITALQSGGSAPVDITVAGLKLPESHSVAASSPHGPWPDVCSTAAQSAALGYVFLLLDLLSSYLGGPLLHEGSFQGSTSVVWQQQSFWNRKPSSINGVLPLYIEDEAGGNPFPSLSAKVRSSTSGWGAVHYSMGGKHPTDSGFGKDSFSDSFLDSSPSHQRNADIKMGYHMLQRSIACFCRDKAAAFNIQLPHGWSPFGWLVVFCTMLKKDATRSDGGSAEADDALIADHAAASRFLRHDDDDDEEEEVDGWDVVHAPSLPPPPSAPDEVEHWTRAMFTDARSQGVRRHRPSTDLGGTLRSPSSLLAALPAAADSGLRALFGKGAGFGSM